MFVYHVSEDGSSQQRAIPDPVDYFYDVSPDAKSLAVFVARTAQVYPADGGSPTAVCREVCGAAGGPNRGITPPAMSWSEDGKFLYLNIRRPGLINAVPNPPDRNLPLLPAGGIRSQADAEALPGVRVIHEARAYVGANPSVYAFPRVTTQRNIYRVSVP